jgi:hypothetical protein
MQMVKIIELPTGKKCAAIELDNLNQITKDFFARQDLSGVDRYVCVYMSYEGEKIFVMAIKDELKKQAILDDLKAELSFKMTNITVAKQL